MLHLTCGSMYCWGNLISYLPAHLKYWDPAGGTGPADAQLVLAFILVSQMTGMPLGPLLEKLMGPRLTAALGGVMMGAGVFLSSYAQNLKQFVLCYSVLFGLGVGIAYQMPFLVGGRFFPKSKGTVQVCVEALAGCICCRVLLAGCCWVLLGAARWVLLGAAGCCWVLLAGCSVLAGRWPLAAGCAVGSWLAAAALPTKCFHLSAHRHLSCSPPLLVRPPRRSPPPLHRLPTSSHAPSSHAPSPRAQGAVVTGMGASAFIFNLLATRLVNPAGMDAVSGSFPVEVAARWRLNKP